MTHERQSKSDDWFTPKYIFDALGVRFDMDVAAPQDGPRYVPADTWLWQGGLDADWTGFVWMNAPFGHQRQKRLWLDKFFTHGNGIALVPDRTSAPWWQEYAPQADAILFVAPKVKFERPDGSIGEQPGSGTCLFGKGPKALRAMHGSGLGRIGVLFRG